MGYTEVVNRLQVGNIVLLDGGTGTELEKRGVSMDPRAWCGPATLENADVLERIHLDYINAGADVITANTYASSRLMLEPAGFGDRLEEINRTAIETAHRARDASGRDDVLVAGSLSHMCPMVGGTSQADLSREPSPAEIEDALGELADLHRKFGCDLVILEMMYYPHRIAPAFRAAGGCGLPVWAGFSARRGEEGAVLSFAPDRDIAFEELLQPLDGADVDVAGLMHTPANTVGDAIGLLSEVFNGPLMAYPDSGYFKMPNWQFEDVIPPGTLREYAETWVEQGVTVLGGCCGLSPEHIAALEPLKRAGA